MIASLHILIFFTCFVHFCTLLPCGNYLICSLYLSLLLFCFAFQIPYINEIMLYLSFSDKQKVKVISLSIIPSRFIFCFHPCYCKERDFILFLQLSNIPLYTRVYVCMYVCIHMQRHTHTHTHKHTPHLYTFIYL